MTACKCCLNVAQANSNRPDKSSSRIYLNSSVSASRANDWTSWSWDFVKNFPGSILSKKGHNLGYDVVIADLILMIHFVLVLFITSCFFLIPVGYRYNWKWVRHQRIRILHACLMFIVTLETALGLTCPLTALENILRGQYQSDSFVGYWMREIIYWDFPPMFFLIAYSVCLA